MTIDKLCDEILGLTNYFGPGTSREKVRERLTMAFSMGRDFGHEEVRQAISRTFERPRNGTS